MIFEKDNILGKQPTASEQSQTPPLSLIRHFFGLINIYQ